VQVETLTLVIMLAVIPGLVSLFIGVFAFRRVAPLVFVCLRCDGVFRHPSHRKPPAACPHCGAHDWDRSPVSARPPGD
jgi:hypothetical protein